LASDKGTTPKTSAAEDTSETALATQAEGGALVDAGFFEGSGEGMEDFGQQDFTVPFIGILQALSKPLQKNHSKYIPGAEQGQFLNSATQETYAGGEPGRDKKGDWNEGGLIVVPAHFEHRYIAWKPNNGGIAHDYGTDPTIYDSIEQIPEGQPNAYKRLDPEGNEVVDTMQYFVLIINPEAQTMEAAVIPFSKTYAKKSKKWNNLIRAHTEIVQGKPVKPAIYFYAYRLTTVPESNDKGSWYSHNIEDYGKLMDMGDFGKSVFVAAKQLREQISAGEIKAAAEEPEGPANTVGDGGGAF
jgi:hypothetical protein